MQGSPFDKQLALAAAAGLMLAAACKNKADSTPGAAATTQASAASATRADKACCKGLNDCRGKGGCALPGKHDCAAQNACKGQGGCNMHCPK